MNWSDFINEILLKGQVREIIIFPRNVQVILKDGAVYRGRSLHRRLDLYNYPDLKDIEEKIRTVERHIGIRMGKIIKCIYHGVKTYITCN